MSHKKVVLSTSLDVQLQVLLTGENEEDIQDETYETWQEEMLDDEDDHELNIKEPEPPIQESIDNNNNNNSDNNNNNNNNNEPADPVQESRDIPLDSKVLRVYAGNVDVGASYYSVRVTERTSVDELLTHALEKFHISQIETQHGRHVGKHSCVEYYLTVKAHDGDEFILDPQDKPYAIHESLTAHLTTPMPSLTQFRQLASGNDYAKRKKKRHTDAPLQFFMHKRIKRVNDKSGQVHIKVSLMTTPPTEKTNTIKKMTTLRRFSKKKETKAERIDKLIATPASIAISELTSIALVKFHLISDKDQPHTYRLILHANGKDTLLHAEQRLSDVLKTLDGTEKYFVLHSFNSIQDRPAQSSTMKPTTSSKVFPETIVHNRNHYLSRGHPVMTRLDSQTESILKRIDAALEAYETTAVQKKPNAFPSPMSVSRNKDGVDIHLPHGLLRSTTLADKKTQYSLMKFPNTLVLQKTVPGKNTDNSSNISGEDMATLVKYGSQYLDAYDAANKPLVTGRLLAEKDSSGKSLSSLEDLEKVKVN
ncbi:uncharacterized protein B0P05DRAFT_464066 [Gilbertella persicaria]|uniref:uncharacterized protein n=1 Tax=Gilbertella persicaria TaxID=101096 RepID=UPI00221EFCE5|nr:uncharacterized protein B0P05DRAFT_464066 [Gilbertella persicaria]KAI8090154.1 hypothetical protein B0P05DRAFT_464066 [Gilbertella persicaria]